jgi:hypothetical protein
MILKILWVMFLLSYAVVQGVLAWRPPILDFIPTEVRFFAQPTITARMEILAVSIVLFVFALDQLAGLVCAKRQRSRLATV